MVDIRDIRLQRLKVLPNSTWVNVNNCGLEYLPDYNWSVVTHLDCNHNRLTDLPPLPSCVNLYCHHNRLTELPPLPSCVNLHCCYNKLVKIRSLPNCIKLDCG